jgi:hypothetical protein
MPGTGNKRGHVTAAAVAIGLHVLVLSFVVTARWTFPARRVAETVTEFVLPRLVPRPQQQHQPTTDTQAQSPRVAVPQIPALPRGAASPGPIPGWITPPEADRTVLEGIGQSLACSLANFDALSDEEKRRCAPRLGANGPPQLFAFTAAEAGVRDEWAAIIEERRILPPCPTGSSNADVGCTKAAAGGLGKTISPVRGDD